MIIELTKDYFTLKDVELVEEFNNGSQEAFKVLLKRYTNKINMIARRFFSDGMTTHDFFQEGSIGLFTAARKYRATRGAFPAFAELHIRGQIINAVKSASRKKYSILNHSFSLDHPYHDGTAHRTFLELIPDPGASPEEVLLQKLEPCEIQRKMNFILRTQLTTLERDVLIKIIEGFSYKDAASEIGVGVKSIDNAYRRVKKKFDRFRSLEQSSH